jgi:hypothetical protein
MHVAKQQRSLRLQERRRGVEEGRGEGFGESVWQHQLGRKLGADQAEHRQLAIGLRAGAVHDLARAVRAAAEAARIVGSIAARWALIVNKILMCSVSQHPGPASAVVTEVY